MSESKRKIRRFNFDGGYIWEDIEGLSPRKTVYSPEEVCEKLNELYEELEELKQECLNQNISFYLFF